MDARMPKSNADKRFYCVNQGPTRDLVNKAPWNGALAASPQAARSVAVQMCAKLRRSRSAGDVDQLRPNLKKAKLLRFKIKTDNGGSTSAAAAAAGSDGACSSSVPTNRALTRDSTAVGPLSSKMTKRAKAVFGGAAPVINKRIPPVDYRARYQELRADHELLKTKCKQRMQLAHVQAKVKQAVSQLEFQESKKEYLQRQLKQQDREIEIKTSKLDRAKLEFSELKTSVQEMQMSNILMSVEVLELRRQHEQHLSQHEQLLNDLAKCQDQQFQSNMHRKELHNTVLDLRGNIRVFCRVRPPMESEQNRSTCKWKYSDEATVELQSIDPLPRNRVRHDAPPRNIFTFDQVFKENAMQKEVFDLVTPFIQSALDGYNVCIFAYGQTGSGKTFTMDGIADNMGIIPRTVNLMFEMIATNRLLGWQYSIKATFLEIYNEVMYDLLNNDHKEMDIRMTKNGLKTDIFVTNITEIAVTDPKHLHQLLNLAKTNRATASTYTSRSSSRSHAITKLKLIGHHAEKQETSAGSINLVDLAGSESPKTSIRMDETKHINRSLSELTNVILALIQKKDHVPYRNSKLTHLLMPSLGGNSKTLMIVNVSPFQDCYQESLKSLRFAASVKSCKMAKPKRIRYPKHST